MQSVQEAAVRLEALVDGAGLGRKGVAGMIQYRFVRGDLLASVALYLLVRLAGEEAGAGLGEDEDLEEADFEKRMDSVLREWGCREVRSLRRRSPSFARRMEQEGAALWGRQLGGAR